ncbi:hypothetical protein MLD38_013729 [Melastoma candidum]|uniref:Uncharacterized protein n=1 Tax=Melastoma candidum TaxID=119954 RepID=A0ACB9RAG9_9MYRT|nr:hypothetical protein MLD38_013729 [Melastoma candidum]
MPPKPLASSLLPYLVLASLLLLCFYSTFLTFSRSPLPPPPSSTISPSSSSCDLFRGKWVYNPSRPKPSYDETCPFHRNSWNFIKNGKPDMGKAKSWEWIPKGCDLERFDAREFLGSMRGRNVGLIGDSLSENLVVALLCALRSGDESGRKWKKKGAWRGGCFQEFNVTVGYHRAVLLAKYCQRRLPLLVIREVMDFIGWMWISLLMIGQTSASFTMSLYLTLATGFESPSSCEWFRCYSLAIFWLEQSCWSSRLLGFVDPDKFPPETPLIFYRDGKPIHPALSMMDGLELVLNSMVSCLFEELLKESQLDAWYDPNNNGVNREARRLNDLITRVLRGTDIRALDFTHLSEFRADAHPAIWLGKKDAVAIWGQDCMHWCLPGVPDTWVDILTQLICQSTENGGRVND